MGERSKVGLIDDPAWQEPPPAPVQRPRKSRAVAVGGAFVLAGLSAATWIVVERDQSGLSACTAVTRTMIERSVGAHVSPGIAGRPDGGVPGATMCQYGAISGTRPSCFPPPPTPGSRCRRQCSLRTDSTSTSTYLGHCPEPPPPWLGRLQPTFRRYTHIDQFRAAAPPPKTPPRAHTVGRLDWPMLLTQNVPGSLAAHRTPGTSAVPLVRAVSFPHVVRWRLGELPCLRHPR